MLVNLKKHINTNLPFLKDSKLLVTVSGGIDSVILTHLLHQLNYKITIAHCNFCLRGKESDLDQQSVKLLANQLQIPFLVTSFDTSKESNSRKLSIQETARNLRYEWFNKILKEQQLDYIITAHNLNDSLETFLINLSRGTGLKGLTGIPEVNKNTVRPLLPFSRKEITAFALENNITWREDKSNANTKYTRNKIRHQVIPVLQELNPNLLSSFKQTLENLQGSASIVADSIKKLKQETREKFDLKILKNLNNPKAYIHEIFSPYNFTNFDDIIDLLSAQSGKQLFSSTHRLIKDRTFLLLEKRQEIRTKPQEIIINKDTLCNFSEVKLVIQTLQKNSDFEPSKEKNTAQFDKNLLKFPLIVRKWQKGDYFYPLGMQGKKKLSKYFKDEKFSLLEKENIWLLLSDNKIIWILGYRQDNRFKVTTNTANILKITSK